MAERLDLMEKLYDFTLYIYPVLSRYPKHEKFVLVSRTLNCLMDLSDAVERANKSTAKKSAMYEADILLSRLRRLLRLAKDLHYFNIHRYGVICGKLTEIGNILGGWIKWAQNTK